MLRRLETTLGRDAVLSSSVVSVIDTELLCEMARAVGCPPQLVDRVERDETECY